MVGLCCAWGKIKCGIESPPHPQSVKPMGVESGSWLSSISDRVSWTYGYVRDGGYTRENYSVYYLYGYWYRLSIRVKTKCCKRTISDGKHTYLANQWTKRFRRTFPSSIIRKTPPYFCPTTLTTTSSKLGFLFSSAAGTGPGSTDGRTPQQLTNQQRLSVRKSPSQVPS